MSVDVTKIPAIMRSMEWSTGARLLKLWFSRPAAVAPRYLSPSTTAIRMDNWVLTFPRARVAYERLLKARIWKTANARERLFRNLRATGKIESSRTSFGDLGRPVPVLDRDHVNCRTVFSDSSALDDLAAALGTWTLRVVVSGQVARAAGRVHVAIDEVGVYAHDSYDFNGRQLLGFWNERDRFASGSNPHAGVAVWNSDFCNWRETHGRGGDFRAYSDLKRVTVSPPDVFELS